MKEQFVELECEIITITAEDVIATSGATTKSAGFGLSNCDSQGPVIDISF